MRIEKRFIAGLLVLLLVIQSFNGIDFSMLQVQKAYADTIPSTESIPTNVNVETTDKTLTVRWDAVAGAESYDVSLNDDDNITNVTSPNHTYDTLESNTQYTVKVRAVSQSGKGLIGDLNCDNTVDALDLALIKKYITDPSYDFPAEDDMWAADVNGDNSIDAIDLALFQKRMLDPNYTFPKSPFIKSEWSTGVSKYTLLATPDNLAISTSGSSTNLTWNAVIGATGYEIYRNSVEIGVSSVNSYSDSGLILGVDYEYSVRAYSDTGNLSAMSSAILITISENTQAPTFTPVGGSYNEVQTVTINCATEGATIRYTTDGSTPTSSSPVYNAPITVSSNMTIKAYASKSGMPDSDISNSIYNINLLPMPPTNIICSNKTDISAELSWTAPGGSSITGYDIYLEGENLPVASTMGETSCIINSLKPSTTYVFIIKTKYTDGSISDASKPFTVVTDKDTTAPSIPSEISVYSRHDTSLTIKWNPSADNDAVAGYEIYRDGKKITTRNSLTYTDSGLTPSSRYSYTVKAYDKAGNISGMSNSLDVTTLSNDDNGNTLTDANPIEIGLQESARINYDGDIDYFYFDTVWTGTYSIQSTGSIDTYCELYDSEGKLIDSNNNLSETNNNFYIKVNLNQYSKYYVKVKTNGATGTGNYGLLVKMVSKVQTSSTSTVTASMGQKLSDLSAVTVNGKIYVMGGHNYLEDGTSDKIRVYDPLTEVWMTKTEVMPKPVWGYGMAVIGNKIYVAGGASKGCTNKAYEYDTEAGTWQQKASLSEFRKGLGLVAVDGKLYAIGGIGSTENSNAVGYIGTVEVFDPANESTGWQTKAIMPMPRADFAAVSFGTNIYIFGGHNKDGLPLNTVDVYDTVNNTWTTLQTKMPISRTGCKAVVRNGKINIIGGFGDKNNFLGDIDVFDPTAGTWSKEINLKVPRMGMASAEANGSIYVMGGYNSEGCTDSVETIDLFKFKIKTTSANVVYNFPIKSVSGAVDIVVNWGDGTTSTISTYSGRSHTYVTAGTYTIKVISFLQMPITFENDTKLIEVLTPIPNIGAYSFRDCFLECNSLTSIPAGLFDNNVNVTDFSRCFEECRSLTTIPAGLFDKNVGAKSFGDVYGGCFMYCKNLTTIPAGLFDKNVNAINFEFCFWGCSNLTAIPAGLFDKNVNVTDFSYCFEYCSSLTSIPAGLFDNNVNVNNFNGCFYGCSSLTSIPAGMFDNNVNATEFLSCFCSCSSLTSIPAGLFDKNVNVTDFSWCFAGCSSLTLIPTGLFDNNVIVNDFGYCFYDCNTLTGLAPPLWLRSTYGGEECFGNCKLLSNYSDIPSNWK